MAMAMMTVLMMMMMMMMMMTWRRGVVLKRGCAVLKPRVARMLSEASFCPSVLEEW